METFEVTINGQRYEVSAPDENAALQALQSQLPDAFGPPSAQQRYDAALENIRQSQFADMTPEQWKDYSSTILAPQGFQGIAQQGQLFGLTDEINAGLGAFGSQVRNWIGDESAPGFGEAYGQYSELEQARRDLGRENLGAPAAIGAEILGGASIFAPANAVATAVQPSRLRAVGAGLGSGAGFGGLYGFGSADENRGMSALGGAAVGGTVGTVAPYLADAGTAAYRTLSNLGARNAAASQMGVSPQAAAAVRQMTGFDGSLGPQGRAALANAGPEAMLIDAGPNAQQLADTILRRPGQGSSVVAEALSGRAQRDASRLNAAMDSALGVPEGLMTQRRDIALSSAAARDQAYKPAYAAEIDFSTPDGMAILDLLRNVPASVRASARKLKQSELGPDASLPMNLAQLPSVQDIDYITRALRLQAEAGEGAGKMGGQNDLGRSFGNLATDLRNLTKSAVPEYAVALETAADPIGRSQAVQFGYDMLGQGTPRDVAASRIAGMTGPEKQAVAAGVRSRIDESMANVQRAVTTGREEEVTQALRALRDLTVPANREKIGLAIGDEAASSLFNQVDQAFISMQREALRRTGSQTAGRLMADDALREFTEPAGIVSTLAQGKPLQSGQRLTQAATGMTPENIALRSDQISTDVARLLVAQGDELARNQAALATYNQAAKGSDAVAQAIARRALAFGTALPYPASIQVQGNRR